MEKLSNQNIHFISEQDGDIERKFKVAISDMLFKMRKEIRAYLVRVSYDNKLNEFNVVICYKLRDEFNEEILTNTFSIFKGMFGAHEHLDVLFLNHTQEKELREVCCPFFTSPLFQVQQADFYLSLDSRVITNSIACFKRKKLVGVNSEGYLLCDIKPEIMGQPYGLGAENIKQLMFACRHKGATLFPVSEWPMNVHVAISLVDSIEQVDYIDEAKIKLMWWGILSKTKPAIPL